MNASGSVSQHSTELSIDSLEKEKKMLKSQAKYLEANEIHEQIKELKERQQKEKMKHLKSTHINERELVENSYDSEMVNLEQAWEENISNYIERCDKEINGFVSKHSKKLRKMKEKLEADIMNSFKPSTGLLNMMRCKEQALKQEKYVEAQGLHVQIEQIKADEELRHLDSKRLAINQQLANYNMKFDKKLQAMRKRQKTLLDEMNIQRNEEISRATRKYENLKRELENSQNIKVNIYEGKHTTSAGRHNGSPEKLNGSTLSPYRQKSLASRSDN